MTSKKIPGLSERVQNYLLCLLFVLLLPLLPLGIEYWQGQKIADKSSTLAASMYAISIGMSSRSRLIFGAGVVISIIFAVAYGMLLGQAPPLTNCGKLALGAIVFVFVFHGLERYNKHVADQEPFFEFTTKKIKDENNTGG